MNDMDNDIVPYVVPYDDNDLTTFLNNFDTTVVVDEKEVELSTKIPAPPPPKPKRKKKWLPSLTLHCSFSHSVNLLIFPPSTLRYQDHECTETFC